MSAQEIITRFRGVENSPPATDDQKNDVADLRSQVLSLAQLIDVIDMNPRYKATALTHLETAAMFAVKGVFQ